MDFNFAEHMQGMEGMRISVCKIATVLVKVGIFSGDSDGMMLQHDESQNDENLLLHRMAPPIPIVFLSRPVASCPLQIPGIRFLSHLCALWPEARLRWRSLG